MFWTTYLMWGFVWLPLIAFAWGVVSGGIAFYKEIKKEIENGL